MASDLRGASVEDVEQDPFPGPHSDRFSMAERSTVDREAPISHLLATWLAVRHRVMHR